MLFVPAPRCHINSRQKNLKLALLHKHNTTVFNDFYIFLARAINGPNFIRSLWLRRFMSLRPPAFKLAFHHCIAYHRKRERKTYARRMRGCSFLSCDKSALRLTGPCNVIRNSILFFCETQFHDEQSAKISINIYSDESSHQSIKNCDHKSYMLKKIRHL